MSLSSNKSIKFLNLFNNKIGFDGAKAFGDTLQKNQSLEFIEFGHNRIRDKGLLQLADGIAKNKSSGLKYLGFRFNYLTETGVVDFLKGVYSTKNPIKLVEIFIKNNQINEYGLYSLKRSFDNLKIDLSVDLFDKLKYL